MSLDGLNSATDDDRLRRRVAACCGAEAWVRAIVEGRPYGDVETLCAVSDAATAALDDVGLGQALAGHPRIGDRSAAAGNARAHAEQEGMTVAGNMLQTRMAAANAEYERRFGHVYLVCASGLSGDQLLDKCLGRLDNDPIAERMVVIGELAKINRLRVTALLDAVDGV